MSINALVFIVPLAFATLVYIDHVGWPVFLSEVKNMFGVEEVNYES
ncbi:hypothetical protein [Lactiplantibacillus pentosus]|nr:hypothetical protein [Lactiplantibacillus pentosus]MCJ8184778.1 hypothetical protein [Lactiplantibacillus pentosus]